jgi:hypothetical protein
VPLLGFYGGDLCYFFAPDAFFWMIVAAFLFTVPLLILFIEAVVRRSWRLSAVFALISLLLTFYLTDVAGQREWLRTVGFYAKTKMISNYLSKCRLADFVEKGVGQTAGFCEGHDRGDYYEAVVYDTTGEFVLPVSERTPEWKAMMCATVKDAQVDRDLAAYHLFGHYYAVVISNFDMTG